jgi:hypothetical protein
VLGVPAQPSGAAAASGWGIVTSPDTSALADNVVTGTTCANAFECWAVGTVISGNGGEPQPLIESWNGSTWSISTSPAPPATAGYGFLAVTCVTGADCWAVGTSPAGGGGGSPVGVLAEHWDGTAWTVVPTPLPAGAAGGYLEGVSCASSADCWAVGSTTSGTGDPLAMLAEHWNGSAWSIVAAAPSGQAYDQLNGVWCVTAADCWAVGSAGPSQQNPTFLPIWPKASGNQGLIEHWDGSSWSIVPSDAAAGPEGSYLTGVTCTGASDCWATGTVTNATGTAGSTLVQHWDGSTWSVVPTPAPAGTKYDMLNGLTCLSATECWAAGTSGVGHQGQPTTFVEHYDGSSWTVEASPQVTAFGFFTSIDCLQGSFCWAVGDAIIASPTTTGIFQTLIEQLVLPGPSSQGLLMATAAGAVVGVGNAATFTSVAGRPLDAPVVGIAATPDGRGYWEVAADGGVFAFGDARFFGSMGGQPLDAPVVGIAATPDGGGYWLAAADGGIFAFGDAQYEGSMGGQHLDAPIVGVAATDSDGGYREVASDGGVFSFGDAAFCGSMGGQPLDAPVVGMASTPDGGGYWLAAADGGVFAFGDAGFWGSAPGQGITVGGPVVAIAGTPDGTGYWIVGAHGTASAFGDAASLGTPAFTLTPPAVTGASSAA